tara:strand:- start:35 stop:223 length:189 start_codon:yes stop_codon:yes gene_type:complete
MVVVETNLQLVHHKVIMVVILTCLMDQQVPEVVVEVQPEWEHLVINVVDQEDQEVLVHQTIF